MPSTYSPSLRLELIGPGEQAGTWNTTTNTNLGTLLESAIAGYTIVPVTSANQAFTALDGAADEARNAVIELTTTGWVSPTNFTVYAPPQEKTYIIYNNTAVTATISNYATLSPLTATGGTTVAIAPSNKTLVFSDGTNFSALSLPSPGTGTVTQVNTATGGSVNGLTLTGGPITTTGTITLGGSLSGTASGLSIGGNAATATFATSAGSATTAGSVSGIVSTGNGGTGSTSLAGAGIPTLSASNYFTGVNGFRVSPNGNVAVFAQAPNSSGAGFVGQNTGVGVPCALATNQPSGTLLVFYNGTFPSVSTAGEVRLGGPGVLYIDFSDYRLKENIVPLSDAVIKLKQLAPKRFTFIDRPEVGTLDGFIAHEVQAVVPQAVSGEKDEVDENGKPRYQGIDSSNLVPLLTAALQEAVARIEALEAKVGA